MSRVRGRDTKPELAVRRLLHAAGLRYRLQGRSAKGETLPGRPDLVFARLSAVVFVHGCFWHMHKCRWGKPVPATNKEFWAEKRRGNAERDKRNRAALRKAGWRVFEVWECETRDPAKLRKKIARLVEKLLSTSAGTSQRSAPARL